MERPLTYTLDEIEGQTGFDKRTIAYYVQEGLLPKVGRRGPRTRYPQAYLDRLLFIKMIREQQDRGRLGNLTLSNIKEMFDDLSEESVADVVAGKEKLDTSPYEHPPDDNLAMMAPRMARLDMLERRVAEVDPDREGNDETISAPLPFDETDALLLDLDTGPPTFELREVGSDSEKVAASGPRPPQQSPPTQFDRLATVLERLAEAAGSRARIRRRVSEHWTRAEITPDLVLTARNLDEEDADLLEEAARMLRWKILRGRRGGR